MLTIKVNGVVLIPELGKKIICPFCGIELISIICSTSLTPSGMIVERESHWRHKTGNECIGYAVEKRSYSIKRDTSGEEKCYPTVRELAPAYVFADGFELYVINDKCDLGHIEDHPNKIWILDVSIGLVDLFYRYEYRAINRVTHRILKNSCYLKAKKLWFKSDATGLVYHIVDTKSNGFGTGLHMSKHDLKAKLIAKHGVNNSTKGA